MGKKESETSALYENSGPSMPREHGSSSLRNTAKLSSNKNSNSSMKRSKN
jgi:hypothetical protein